MSTKYDLFRGALFGLPVVPLIGAAFAGGAFYLGVRTLRNLRKLEDQVDHISSQQYQTPTA
jgi:HAMP domain-containing protein